MDPREIFKDVLKEMLERKASDMHIGPGHVTMQRVHGDLEPSKNGIVLTQEQTMGIADIIMGDRLKEKFEKKREVDTSFSVEGGTRFRVNVYSKRGGVNIALRVIPSDVPGFEELGLPGAVETLAQERRGLILVTGTTGCGKSTTLASIIDYINTNRKSHIITIEDPVEFMHKNKKSIVNQRELGLDTLSYADALRNVVRQDPDVILVGEMRDYETMAAAITSAQTGHLVLSTVHTTNTIQTINRIVDMFPPHQHNQIRLQMAETLKGVISQRLLPRTDVAARVAALEVMVVTPLIKKAIEDNNFTEVSNALRQGQYYGMQTFNQALLKLYNEGKVTLEEATAAASNPEEFMLTVRGVETGTSTNSMFEQ